MNCPNCKNQMKEIIFDIGYGIEAKSKHCEKCGFNVTKDKELKSALNSLREKMTKETKIIRIGTGLGVRIPNALVKSYDLEAQKKIQLKAEIDGIKIISKNKAKRNI